MRRSKIVCTLGPASSTPAAIGGLIDAGMDIARLNFSHGDYETHLAAFRTVRAEADKRGRAVGILQDLQGPKIRVGKFAKVSVELTSGTAFTITTPDLVGHDPVGSTTYKHLPTHWKQGD